MRVGSLCTGIGGAELALEMLGVEVELAWYADLYRANLTDAVLYGAIGLPKGLVK